MLRNILSEANGKIRGLCYSQDTKEAVTKAAVETLTPVHDFMEGHQWLIGDTFTYLDLVLLENHEFLDALTDGHIFETFPRFKTHWEAVRALPQIKAYHTGPRSTKALPFNGGPAKVNFVGREY